MSQNLFKLGQIRSLISLHAKTHICRIGTPQIQFRLFTRDISLPDGSSLTNREQNHNELAAATPKTVPIDIFAQCDTRLTADAQNRQRCQMTINIVANAPTV